ncbi:RcnB family protein [Brevundimonas sp.]|uniref:RcnB family protein n=1 Tax=Brevundimonas sp. TaxID=1871086 RepID=UPI0035B4DD7F
MKRSFMVAVALASFAIPAAAPLAVLAQDAESRGGRRGAALQNGGEERQARLAEARAARERSRQPRAEAPAAPRPERREDRQERREERRENRQERREERRENRQERREGPRTALPQPRPARPELRQDRREDRRENRQERREDRRDTRQDRREDRREWRQERREDRRERRQDRREYREFRDRFNADHWRRDWNRRHAHDWWRHDRRWRGFSGVRIGFYFAPGYGYYSVPRSYWNQRWHVGQYLPSIFWRYQLNDWRTYGLGYPPPGARWVLVDNHIYLIDEFDGYIIDVIYDAWAW